LIDGLAEIGWQKAYGAAIVSGPQSNKCSLYGVFLVKKFMQSGTSFFIRQFLCSI